MTYYPVNLRLAGRDCLVVGGGAVAGRKAEALLAAGARVTVLSPELAPPLAALAAAGKVVHRPEPYRPGAIGNFFIVICATDDAAVNSQAAMEARRGGALVNVADDPEAGDFTVPARVARGDLLLTVSTGGKSPALAARLRRELEERYGPEYGEYLALLARLRDEVKENLAGAAARGDFWREALDGEILALLKAGRVREAEEKIIDATGRFGTES
jgi:precorrin-2 dehydrogenase/sirohydrochlorin ferrochelatase